MTLFKKILRNVLVVISLLTMALGLLSSNTAFAQTNVAGGLPDQSKLCNNDRGRLIDCETTDLAELAGNIAGVMTFIIVSIAIIFIVYGAFVWMTNQEDGAKTGRKIITNAVIALIISVVAYGVVAAIIGFLSTTNL